MVAREAVISFSRSAWVRTHKLILETDSLNVVKWLSKPDSTPWRMRRYVVLITNLTNSFLGWSIQHVYREGNSVADSLAKSGIHRSQDLFVTF
ncbi:hypothetical protein DITRI_Ditri03aG0168300 [Diplodiscus trichospermus]